MSTFDVQIINITPNSFCQDQQKAYILPSNNLVDLFQLMTGEADSTNPPYPSCQAFRLL